MKQKAAYNEKSIYFISIRYGPTAGKGLSLPPSFRQVRTSPRYSLLFLYVIITYQFIYLFKIDKCVFDLSNKGQIHNTSHDLQTIWYLVGVGGAFFYKL